MTQTSIDNQERILDKLDQLQVDLGSVAKEQARIQGTQDGTKLAIEAVSNALGDVTKVKIESATLSAQVAAIVTRLDAFDREQRDARWQNWASHTLSGLIGGGGAVALAHFLK